MDRKSITPNAPARPEMIDAIAKAPELLRELGISNPDRLADSELGRGASARAFATPDGRVLKLTVDPTDAMVSSMVAQQGKIPGLVEVDAVYRVPAKVREFRDDPEPRIDLYAIVVEYVRPLTRIWPPDRGLPPSISPAQSSDLKLAAEALAEAVADRTGMSRHLPARPMEETLAMAMEEADRSGVGPDGMTYLYDLVRGWTWMADQGHRMGDLHRGNIGLTMDGRAVLLDLGMSADSAVSAKHAQGLALAANPAAPRDIEVRVRFPRMPNRPGYVRLIAEDDEGMFTIAYANVRVGDNVVSIEEANVAEEHRGEGYGRRLYEEVFKAAAERGLAVESDRSRSDSAEAFWSGLADAGHARGVGQGGIRLVPKAGRDFAFRASGTWPHLYWRVDNPGAVGQLARNPSSSVDAVFDECFDRVEGVFPDFGTCEFYEDEKAGADNGAGSERQFAYCQDGNPIAIAFAPKSAALPRAQLVGLMRHEFGHALEYRYGVKELERRLGRRLPEKVERRADAIAEAVWEEPIVYDERLVQCVGVAGIRPRPAHLPDEKVKLRANPSMDHEGGDDW